MGRKYFWLKLKEDFFRQKEIKKLRKIAGGDTYTIIFLKMQLLSIKNEGKLYYDEVEETFAEELALEIDEEADNVQITLMYLTKHKLIEQVNENEYFIPTAASNIGSETAGAERVRRHREKQKALQCNTQVTFCNTEIERDKREDIDIDIDIDIERREKREDKDNSQSRLNSTDVFRFIDKCGFRLTPLQFEEISEDINNFGHQWVMDAAKESSNRGKFSYNYLKGILNNWLSEGRKEGDSNGKSSEDFGQELRDKGIGFTTDDLC